MNLGSLVLPGCSFRDNFDENCQLGVIAQSDRVQTALQFWRTGMPINFTGTAEEAARKAAQIHAVAPHVSDHVVYDTESRTTKDHGEKLRTHVENIKEPLGVVTHESHWPRVALSLWHGLGHDVVLVFIPTQPQNNLGALAAERIAAHEPAAVGKNIAAGAFTQEEYDWASSLRPYRAYRYTDMLSTAMPLIPGQSAGRAA